MPARLKLFLIEDDNDDREFLEVALSANNVDYSISVVNRGDLVESWLENCQELPDVIVMDLNLPKKHGREVLLLIRNNKRFKDIPILVLTTSSSADDRKYCMENGAAMFLSKPTDVPGFKNLTNAITNLGFARRSN